MRGLTERLGTILGPRGWLSGADVAGYARDGLGRYGEPPLGVARPASTGEVSAVVEACHSAGVTVVPQGGNTGLCGAAVCGTAGGVILSLMRMNRIGEPDPATGAVEVESGVVLAGLHAALEEHGLFFPMHLGAGGAAQIGGLIGTNAGGSHSARYGMMQDLVLGLEVVLHDGTVWDGMRSVQKDNAGYQLRKLFCGAEGTLGVVTRAVLKLFPAPRRRATALVAVPSMEALGVLGMRLRAEAGEFLNASEFFCDLGLDLSLRLVEGLEMPLKTRARWYLLVELASGSERVPLAEILESVLEDGFEAGHILDGTVAMSEAQRASFWRLREEQPEGQRLEGAQLKHDISVPPGQLAAFIGEGEGICQKILPGVRINPFGHLGDGNIHYNLSPPEGQAGFGDTAVRFATELGSLASRMGGSFAAEHGLGRSKIAIADALRSPVERTLMSAIKMSLDPQGTMNPGVIVTEV